MRISLQLRDAAGARWQRSVYVDAVAQERTVYFDDVLPVAYAGSMKGSMKAPLTDIRSVLFVVDTVNTPPGASARIWIQKPRFEQ